MRPSFRTIETVVYRFLILNGRKVKYFEASVFGINPHFSMSALFVLTDCSLVLELCRIFKAVPLAYDFALCFDDLMSMCRPTWSPLCM
jgi:hypothetical protein